MPALRSLGLRRLGLRFTKALPSSSCRIATAMHPLLPFQHSRLGKLGRADAIRLVELTLRAIYLKLFGNAHLIHLELRARSRILVSLSWRSNSETSQRNLAPEKR